MGFQQKRVVFTISVLLLLVGCASSPKFVDGNKPLTDEENSQFNAVYFKVEDQFITSPPQCVAIMPLANKTGDSRESNNGRLKLTDEKLEQLRWILYSHLAPHPYQDIELKEVDKTLSKLASTKQYKAIGQELRCDSLLLGDVTEYDSDFLGFYSQTSIGVELKLISAKDGAVLWQGRHIAKSHAGSVPITPVDIAVGVYSATENISDETVIRVEDELFRRLLSTWHQQNPQTENTTLATVDDESSFHVTAQKLFLRLGPGRHFNAADVLEHKEKLTLLDSQHSPWVQVKVADGQLGYVHKKYIQSSY